MNTSLAVFPAEEPHLHVSVSAVKLLQLCPRAYGYRYIVGAKDEQMPVRMVLGKAIHESLAQYYRALRDGREAPSVDEMYSTALGVCEEQTLGDVPVVFESKESWASISAEARQLLDIFVAKPFIPAKVLGVEEKFTLRLVDPVTGEEPFEEVVSGVFDLVCIDEQGRLTVVDHKVGKRKANDEFDLQLALYSWAAQQLYAATEPPRLAWQCLLRGKTPKVELVELPRVEHDETEAVQSMLSGVALIRATVAQEEPLRLLGRRRSWACAGCGYARRCAGERL